jgi:hypothetical protein
LSCAGLSSPFRNPLIHPTTWSSRLQGNLSQGVQCLAGQEIDYRALAEALRVAIFWKLTGVGGSADEEPRARWWVDTPRENPSSNGQQEATLLARSIDAE